MTQSPLYNVMGAITLPETFPISYRPEGVKNVLFADIKKYCASYDIKCIVMKQGMKESDLFEQVKTWSPDLFIVVGWYHIIPKSWLDLAPAYGLHASLLPDYSDGAALVPVSPWFREQTVAPLSANNLLKLKMRTNCNPYKRVEEIGGKLLQENLPRIADGAVQRNLQDESKRRTFPPRNPEDGKIDWSLPTEKIYDFVRAQTKPCPAAFSSHGKDKVMMWSCRINKEAISQTLLPSEFSEAHQRIFTGCGEGSVLELLNITVKIKMLHFMTGGAKILIPKITQNFICEI